MLAAVVRVVDLTEGADDKTLGLIAKPQSQQWTVWSEFGRRLGIREGVLRGFQVGACRLARFSRGALLDRALRCFHGIVQV